MYKIGEFSRLTQVPVKTLRYYDEIGLLQPAHVERTGYRWYSALQFQRINQILVFKDLGFSLDEIQHLLLDAVTARGIRDAVQRKHDEMTRRLDRERARLARAAARLELLERSGMAAVHDVAIRETSAMLVASVRDILGSHDECERLFEELEHRVGRHIEGQRRGAIWHECAAGAVDCEAFLVLPAHIDPAGRVRVREIPAQHVASLIYQGDHDFIGNYRAMHAWLTASGAEVAGPKREIFLDEGRADAVSVTEIQFPIRLAAA
jgi:DNA-binding transcriptional MerR regulator